MIELDKYDKNLLSILQKDGKASTKELAEQTNLSVSPCWRRIKRLEDDGVIEKYVAVLNRKSLGFYAQAYLHISLIDHKSETIEKFDQLVRSEERIIDCSSVTGENDYVLKVVARDPEDLEQFIMVEILRSGLVGTSTTTFILRNTKSGSALPLD